MPNSLALALSLVMATQTGPAGEPMRAVTAASDWTIDDLVALESAQGFQISPDGRWVVWEKERPDLERNRLVTEIHLTSLQDGVEIQLTRGASDRTPRWSPDGRWIAFLSTRPPPPGEDENEGGGEEGGEEGGEDDEETSQIWLMEARGGEPRPLTSRKNGVQAFAWLDAKTVIFTAPEAPSLQEATLEKSKDDAIVVEDEEHFVAWRLFSLDVESGRTLRRTDNDDQIAEFAPSPDGRWVVARHHVSPHYEADAREKPKFFLYDLARAGVATRRQIFPDPLFFPYGFIWARDGSGFYCLRTLTSDPVWNGPGVETLHWFDMASGSHREVPLEWPNGIGGTVGYDVTQDGFIALLADGPVNRLARFRRHENTWKRSLLGDPKGSHVDSFEVGPDGATIVFNHSTASSFRQAYAGRLAGDSIENQREIAPVNEELRKRRMARTEVVRWTGALGDEVSGILFYPLEYEPGRRYPLVLMIHGGPNSVDLDSFDESWAYPGHLMAGRGAFVLKPNYHGSTNHGQAFAESIKQRYYELEIPDILKGIDRLVEQGKVDPDRLGSIGWSNGAILTWELITRTERFKVAAPGAGDVNWTGDYGNCSFGAWFSNYYMGGPPWEKAKVYIEKSPYFRLGKVTTPTLIFFGTEDRSVDTGQGWEAYRALQQIGRAPVRFLLFPGEGHGLDKPSHQRRKLEEELAWFDRYLFGRAGTVNEALKENSPLDLALKVSRAARDGVRLGVLQDGSLRPETVPWPSAPGGPAEVGRFEVTRAQYAQFDRTYGHSDSTANLPASGITLDRARAYCEWLSKRAGVPYRLPTPAELEALMDLVSDDPLADVTLDHWAGYRLGPDDARRLAPKLLELSGDAPLLRVVGSATPVDLLVGGAPASDEASFVFDLGGNVSEWADDGSNGKTLGCDASRSCESPDIDSQAPPAYTGFRVIRRR